MANNIFLFIFIFLISCTGGNESIKIKNIPYSRPVISSKAPLKINLPYSINIGPDKSKGEIGVLAGGDVMLDWGVKEVIQKFGYRHPGKYIKPLASRYHISICNLETPISKNCRVEKNKLFTFWAHPDFLQSLTYIGINGVMLSNNHIGDCQKKGIEDTIYYVKNSGIQYSGIGISGKAENRKHMHFSVNNEIVSILAYGIKTIKKYRTESGDNLGAYYPTKKTLKEDLRYWQEHSDYLIVSLHWGTEYTERPSRKQRNLARSIIDLGADAVIGHHAHWVQGIQKYKHGVIVYSLGNFIFGSNNPFLRNGYLVGLIFENKKIRRLEIYPMDTRNIGKQRFQPILLQGKQSQKILKKIQQKSKEFKTKIKIRGSMGIITINEPEFYKLNHHYRWMMEKRYRRKKIAF